MKIEYTNNQKSVIKVTYHLQRLSPMKKNKEKNLLKKTIPPLATPSDLSLESRQEIAEAINPLIADTFALYVKTRNFHWHLSGRHFRDYHLLFDEQADQLHAMADPLAERLRKLGQPTIRSISHISQLQKIKDDNSPYLSAEEMIQQLLNDNKEFTARMRAAHEVCDSHHDCATTSLLEVFIDEAERRTWFLFEITIEE